MFGSRKLLGMIVSLCGVCLVCIPPMLNHNEESSGEKLLEGVILTFFSAIGWGAYEVAFEFVLRYKPKTK